MIKLGIDARPITNQHLGGIGVYTKAVLQRLLHDDRFEVFCYANHPLVWFSEYFDKRHFRLLNGRPSAFFTGICGVVKSRMTHLMSSGVLRKFFRGKKLLSERSLLFTISRC